ncbi:hypothetical protein TCAL_06486 [Tigriopus californicus]|uniref:Protein Churchill n=1 Tax=Tigriopus californicus TaxID=6832 RepID=A0A553PK47_TIGCA|nr:protein Churchill-like [Tigriopus californicus]TRY78055.1 hypothetical protein TCAL_06486 [Tigriopus californicus]|eukprot:TCALIF_06486-PA protein Name:"Similar to CHURC1 Protein Churchill (Gallus gallus)" AED:0.00 eAED:0.00 QI:93/1/1/1/0.5/0.66/3/913/103
MCYKCVKDKTLDRGTFCSDTCCLLSNFAQCSECGSTSALEIQTDKPVTVQGDTEVLTRNHLCRCGHVIGEHTSEFWVESGHQEYRMDCHLCGFGEDSISIVPK